ncbi:N-acetylmuramoyl-L-alanine amidase family protein [Konateibacter massiliensis]|uniref:N-acetylmuramoyl-L-alanine amidase family protein n=1 Tax=Konateibacter massiliensis TaxID=2002841 RepID=UPI000C145984|nr:N-acetylmuramoyl-L-alanine amidase [Konateibacter massiliensis]
MTLEEKLIRKTAIGSILFAIGVSVILFKLPGQAVIETIFEQEPVSEEETLTETDLNSFGETKITDVENKRVSYLKIPLPSEVNEADIKIENSYINQTIIISISNIDKNFFSDNPLNGSSDHISDIVYDQGEGVAQVELVMDGVYEYDADFSDGSLNMSFIEPKSIYDKIVVIDAGHGSYDNGAEYFNTKEKDINLAVVLKLKELLDASDIKAYYTRLDDTKPTNLTRVNFANGMEADFFISVHNNGDTKASSSAGTEVLYNEKEAESDFGSKQLAQLCQDELVSLLGSRDRGIVAGTERAAVINHAEIAAALVEIGFISNQAEVAKLNTESYQEKAAQAIYNALVKAFEERDGVSASGTEASEEQEN